MTKQDKYQVFAFNNLENFEPIGNDANMSSPTSGISGSSCKYYKTNKNIYLKQEEYKKQEKKKENMIAYVERIRLED